MGVIFRHISALFSCKRTVVLLVFFWSMGLFLGIGIAAALGEKYSLLMRVASSSCVSIVGLTVQCYLPFLVSALAVHNCRWNLVYLCCFTKALLFSSCAYASTVAFASAGWLVQFLLQFSDILSIPALFWFLFRDISGSGCFKRDFAFCTAWYIGVGILDFGLISPFLVSLIDH